MKPIYPLLISEVLCQTEADLLVAAKRDWYDFFEALMEGGVEDWVSGVLGNKDLAEKFREIKDRSWLPEEKVMALCYALDPSAPPFWMGESITKTWLKSLVQEAKSNANAKSKLEAFISVFDTLPHPGLRELQAVYNGVLLEIYTAAPDPDQSDGNEIIECPSGRSNSVFADPATDETRQMEDERARIEREDAERCAAVERERLERDRREGSELVNREDIEARELEVDHQRDSGERTRRDRSLILKLLVCGAFATVAIIWGAASFLPLSAKLNSERQLVTNEANKKTSIHTEEAKDFPKPDDHTNSDAEVELGIKLISQNDFESAVSVLNSAAIKNNPNAQYLLGTMYRNGVGVRTNKSEAYRLIDLAANANSRNLIAAKYQLANIYETGDGVEKDIQAALVLYRSVIGYKDAKNAVDRLENVLKNDAGQINVVDAKQRITFDSGEDRNESVNKSKVIAGNESNSIYNIKSVQNPNLIAFGTIKSEKPCDEVLTCIDLMLLSVANENNKESLNISASRLSTFNKYIRGDRKVARSLNEQGLALFKSGDIKTSILTLARGVESDPQDEELRSNLVFVALRGDDFKLAEREVISALITNPRRSNTWTSVSELFAVHGNEELSYRALLLAYEFSSNKQKTIDFYSEKAISSERVVMQPIYKRASETLLVSKLRNAEVSSVKKSDSKKLDPQMESNVEPFDLIRAKYQNAIKCRINCPKIVAPTLNNDACPVVNGIQTVHLFKQLEDGVFEKNGCAFP